MARFDGGVSVDFPVFVCLLDLLDAGRYVGITQSIYVPDLFAEYSKWTKDMLFAMSLGYVSMLELEASSHGTWTRHYKITDKGVAFVRESVEQMRWIVEHADEISAKQETEGISELL